MIDDKQTDGVIPADPVTELDDKALDKVAGGVPRSDGNVPSMDDWQKHNG